MRESAPRGLIPPRPNLGPEPWQEPQSWAGVWIASVVLLFVLCATLLGRRSLARRATKTRPLPLLDPRDATPRDRMVALCDTLRKNLTERFGIAWRAKTTEELAADGQLQELLGPEDFPALIRFLDHVDKLKFASERALQQHDSLEEEIVTWVPRVTTLIEKIRAKPEKRRRAKSGAVPSPRS